MTWMRLKEFCSTYGIPVSVMKRAVHGAFSDQIARKAKQDSDNSPWLINVERALKLFKEGFI